MFDFLEAEANKKFGVEGWSVRHNFFMLFDCWDFLDEVVGEDEIIYLVETTDYISDKRSVVFLISPEGLANITEYLEEVAMQEEDTQEEPTSEKDPSVEIQRILDLIQELIGK